MDASEEIAPAVAAILDSARERIPVEQAPLSVTARSFEAAVRRTEQAGRIPVISEVKPTSPTSDHHRTDDPIEIAENMEAAGATAISVLTEPAHFGGDPDTLTAIREAVDVPVLRKDFIVHEAQLDVVSADLVLLIARFVDDLHALLSAAESRGFQVLVEVHSAHEIRDAIDAGANIIGINNRDLGALEVNLATFEELAPLIPDDVLLIAESGITSPSDARRMRNAGADALLIGSAIMAGDVYEKTALFVEAGQ